MSTICFINELRKYYYTREKYPHYFLTNEEYLQIPEEKRKEVRINLEEQITELRQFYQIRRCMYVRRNMNRVCPTLTANMWTGGHNVPLVRVDDGIRKITPKEAFKLQGFSVGDGEIPSIDGGSKFTTLISTLGGRKQIVNNLLCFLISISNITNFSATII